MKNTAPIKALEHFFGKNTDKVDAAQQLMDGSLIEVPTDLPYDAAQNIFALLDPQMESSARVRLLRSIRMENVDGRMHAFIPHSILKHIVEKNVLDLPSPFDHSFITDVFDRLRHHAYILHLPIEASLESKFHLRKINTDYRYESPATIVIHDGKEHLRMHRDQFLAVRSDWLDGLALPPVPQDPMRILPEHDIVSDPMIGHEHRDLHIQSLRAAEAEIRRLSDEWEAEHPHGDPATDMQVHMLIAEAEGKINPGLRVTKGTLKGPIANDQIIDISANRP